MWLSSVLDGRRARFSCAGKERMATKTGKEHSLFGQKNHYLLANNLYPVIQRWKKQVDIINCTPYQWEIGRRQTHLSCFQSSRSFLLFLVCSQSSWYTNHSFLISNLKLIPIFAIKKCIQDYFHVFPLERQTSNQSLFLLVIDARYPGCFRH